MKRIIVPTDFSDTAYNALLLATRLFPKEVCEIILLHSYEEEFTSRTSRIDIGKSDELYDELQKRFSKSFEALKHSIVRDSENYSCTFKTHDTSLKLFKAINKRIKDSHIDLIIMGTKGATGLKEVLIGSQAISVLKRITDCPLLLVPEQSEFTTPKEICFASDFKKSHKEDEISLVRDIAAQSGGSVHIAHVYDQKEPDIIIESNYKLLKEQLGALPFNTHWISANGRKAKALQDFIENYNIELLVMIYNKHNWFDKLFREPVIKNIGFHTQKPFLIIPSYD